MRVGSTPTTFPPSACSAVLESNHISNWNSELCRLPYHSSQVGTFSIPRFRSTQLLSSCFSAWLKYRPSVDKAAFAEETTAVPAEPVNPEIYSISLRRKHGRDSRMRRVCFAEGQVADLDGHHTGQCTRIGDYLRTERLLRAKTGKNMTHSTMTRKKTLGNGLSEIILYTSTLRSCMSCLNRARRSEVFTVPISTVLRSVEAEKSLV